MIPNYGGGVIWLVHKSAVGLDRGRRGEFGGGFLLISIKSSLLLGKSVRYYQFINDNLALHDINLLSQSTDKWESKLHIPCPSTVYLLPTHSEVFQPLAC